MSGQTKEQRLNGVHARAMARFDAIQSALKDERLQCLEDRRFYSIAGAQWEGPLGEQFENKPRFEMNKVHLAVIRIINEYRNNRISVDFTPKDGSENDRLADTCDGLYRADEQDFNADEAKDNAFEEAVGGGFGAFRLRACYEDEEDDENTKQRIRFEPIFDADSCVFFDLDAKRQDKADAKHCFVLSSMTRQAYTDEYNDDPSSWPKTIHRNEFDWCTPDVIYLAEYYEVEQKTEVIAVYRGLALGDDEPNEIEITEADLKEDPDREGELQATGYRRVREKRVKRTKVHKYLLNGMRVIEDQGYLAGTCIPIIPVYGKRWFVDNVERCMGHVRLARDAQMLKNMLISSLGEIAASSPIEKPILTPNQVAGHQIMWAEDNVKRYPYLLVNPIVDKDGNPIASGPLAYTKPPSIPPALAALLQVTEEDLKDLLGNQQAGEQMQPNMSGKAVELIQNRLDMQVFIYMSNMAKAMKRCGEVWLSMARDIYVEEGRKMKTIAPDGDVGGTELMRPVYDAESEKTAFENNLEDARFDVVVDVGPSSSSKRAATVRAVTGMMQLTSDPETATVLTSLAMMNMEGEGISELRDYFRRKLLRLGAVKPTEQESEKMREEAANVPPDPNAQYLEAAAQESVAKAGKAQADAALTMAKVDESRANTVKTLTEANVLDRQQAQQTLQTVQDPQQAQ